MLTWPDPVFSFCTLENKVSHFNCSIVIIFPNIRKKEDESLEDVREDVREEPLG